MNDMGRGQQAARALASSIDAAPTSSPVRPHASGGLSCGLPVSLKSQRLAERYDHIFQHFARRAAERMEPIDPLVLWDCLIRAISEDTPFVRFACAAKQRGRQVWRFRLKSGAAHYCIWDIHLGVPVTILPSTGRVVRRGKNRLLELRGND